MQPLDDLSKIPWRDVQAGDLTITLRGDGGAAGHVCIGGTRTPLRDDSTMCGMMYVCVTSDAGPIYWRFCYDTDNSQRILMRPSDT